MLLIFFLVTSSMNTEKGLQRQLPPLPDGQQKPLDVQREHVIAVRLDSRDTLSCDGTVLTPGQLTERLVERIAADPQQHVVAIETSRSSTYEAYYHVQNAIVRAYTRLRLQRASQLYHRPYSQCSPEEREAIDRHYPQRISESRPQEEGGKHD